MQRITVYVAMLQQNLFATSLQTLIGITNSNPVSGLLVPIALCAPVAS